MREKEFIIHYDQHVVQVYICFTYSYPGDIFEATDLLQTPVNILQSSPGIDVRRTHQFKVREIVIYDPMTM